MYENELTRGNNVHLEAADEGRGGANSWLATQPLWGAYSIRFERWTVIFSVNFDYIWEVLKVLESGSGEDLAVFCRSVISYCGKKGVEVKETIIRQKKDPRKYPKLSLFNGWQKKFKSKWRECTIEWKKIGIVTQVEPCLYSCLAGLSSPSPDHVDYDVSGKK